MKLLPKRKPSVIVVRPTSPTFQTTPPSDETETFLPTSTETNSGKKGAGRFSRTKKKKKRSIWGRGGGDDRGVPQCATFSTDESTIGGGGGCEVSLYGFSVKPCDVSPETRVRKGKRRDGRRGSNGGTPTSAAASTTTPRRHRDEIEEDYQEENRKARGHVRSNTELSGRDTVASSARCSVGPVDLDDEDSCFDVESMDDIPHRNGDDDDDDDDCTLIHRLMARAENGEDSDSSSGSFDSDALAGLQDDDLMSDNDSPGTLRLTAEGLKRHERKQLQKTFVNLTMDEEDNEGDRKLKGRGLKVSSRITSELGEVNSEDSSDRGRDGEDVDDVQSSLKGYEEWKKKRDLFKIGLELHVSAEEENEEDGEENERRTAGVRAKGPSMRQRRNVREGGSCRGTKPSHDTSHRMPNRMPMAMDESERQRIQRLKNAELERQRNLQRQARKERKRKKQQREGQESDQHVSSQIEDSSNANAKEAKERSEVMSSELSTEEVRRRRETDDGRATEECSKSEQRKGGNGKRSISPATAALLSVPSHEEEEWVAFGTDDDADEEEDEARFPLLPSASAVGAAMIGDDADQDEGAKDQGDYSFPIDFEEKVVPPPPSPPSPPSSPPPPPSPPKEQYHPLPIAFDGKVAPPPPPLPPMKQNRSLPIAFDGKVAPPPPPLPKKQPDHPIPMHFDDGVAPPPPPPPPPPSLPPPKFMIGGGSSSPPQCEESGSRSGPDGSKRDRDHTHDDDNHKNDVPIPDPVSDEAGFPSPGCSQWEGNDQQETTIKNDSLQELFSLVDDDEEGIGGEWVPFEAEAPEPTESSSLSGSE